jgi:hypothetical protein
MSEAAPQAIEQRQADIAALRRELEKMATKVKRRGTTAKQPPADIIGSVLVIKGK